MVKKKIEPIVDKAECNSSITLFSRPITHANIHQLTKGLYSKSSELAMASDWNRFINFCVNKHVRPLPASITAIRLFLENESFDRKFSSLRRYSVTIGTIHIIHGLADPTAHRQVKFTLQQLRTLKHGDARQANPLQRSHLLELDTILRQQNLVKSLRDLSIYYLMFECALKRSDLRQIQLSDLTFKQQIGKVTIRDHQYLLSAQASKALLDWINQLQGNEGHLFRRIDKHGNIGINGLDDSSIYRVLRNASDLLGLSREHRFTGQSARVGATKELKDQGYSLQQIQEFGRWLSPAMPAQYLNQADTAQAEMMRFKNIKPWD